MTTNTLPVRTTDPSTSREAAASAVTKRPPIREAVLGALTDLGPMTHDELIYLIEASPSGIRTRTSELVRDGLVEAVPESPGKSDLGNRATYWRLVTV